jgi:hypothetical protein
MEPVDVYCVDHERFLPLTTELPGRARVFVVYLLRLLLCGAVLLTAHTGATLPVFLAAVGVGAALLGLPLRRYRLNWRLALTGWALACSAILVLRSAEPRLQRAAWTVALVALLAAAVFLVNQVTWSNARHRAAKTMASSWRRDVNRWAVLTVGTAATAPAALVLYGAARWLLIDQPARTWILVVAAGGATGAGLVAAIGGALLGFDSTLLPPPQIQLPRRPTPVRWSLPVSAAVPAASSAAERLYQGLNLALTRIAAVSVASVRAVTNAALAVLHHAKRIGVAIVNGTIWLGVQSSRRLVRCVVATGRVLRLATALGARAGRHAVHVLILPGVSLAVGALLANQWATAVRDYLIAGSISALAAISALTCVAAGSLAAVWLALCNLPLRRSAPSLGRSAAVAGAHLVLILSFGGWLLGLPGTFGHGKIRVGWITLAATTLLLAASAWALVQRRREAKRTARTHLPPDIGILTPPPTPEGIGLR